MICLLCADAAGDRDAFAMLPLARQEAVILSTKTPTSLARKYWAASSAGQPWEGQIIGSTREIVRTEKVFVS